jgi:hypothetical protein
MKAAHNKQHQQLEFAVGDWAWFRLNQHAAVSVRDSPLSKLAPKYFGPYQVIERLGPVTYRLQLPPHARIHDVFHVAFLKRFDGAAPTAIAPLPPIVCGRTVCLCLRKSCMQSRQPILGSCSSNGKGALQQKHRGSSWMHSRSLPGLPA